MTPTPRTLFPAALGFAFVYVCFDQTLWVALLCLLGAALFHGGALLARGDTSLAELQERAEAARTGFRQPSNVVPRAPEAPKSRVI